ncbi:WXG100 family type VII secretion target, partial [Nocardia sp. NPDC004823]
GTTTAGARAAGAGSGAAGRAGMPGMGAPGARGGGKDDESTRGIPDYLVTQEHGDELTGLDNLPKLVPPVIGAD